MAERRIDPNLADLEALRQLPGIGAGLAQRIVDGRPYRSAEDLLAVPGLGSGTLERIRPRLRFGAAEEQVPIPSGAAELAADQVGESVAASEADATASDERAEPARSPAERDRPAEAQPADDQPTGLRRWIAGRSAVWAGLALVAVSVLCSVSLTLTVLLGINGTLDYGRHATVQRAERQLRELESGLVENNSELGALRRRLEVIESLSGRMTAVEGRMDQLERQVERMANALEGVQQQLDAAQQQADRIDRLERFVSGLQRLLVELFGAPEG